MPYFSRKISENKVCVYKKDTNEKVGCTTPAKLDKYMKALHVNEPKNVNKKPIFNYIQDIDESGIATLYIYDTIGAYFDPETEKVKCTINGKDFAKEMEYLQDKAKLICIRINSGGGNVLDGYGIIDSILSSKVPVHTYNVGIAASIASLIFLAGHRRIMNDYSTLMIHNPSMAENENSKLLNVIKKQLVTFLANNCIYSQQELSDLMDEETYFDAEECIESGLVDEINNTGRNIPKMEKTNVLEMANIYNQLLLKDKDMKKVKNTAEETDKDFTTKKEKVAIKNKKKLKEAEKEEKLKPLDKKTSINEEAMNRIMRQEQIQRMETELREMIIYQVGMPGLWSKFVDMREVVRKEREKIEREQKKPLNWLHSRGGRSLINGKSGQHYALAF